MRVCPVCGPQWSTAPCAVRMFFTQSFVCQYRLRKEGVMLTYTIRRLLIAIPIFLGITVLLYILVSITPDGGPLAAYVGPGKHLTAQQYQALVHKFGLDQPLPVRYFKWLAS